MKNARDGDTVRHWLKRIERAGVREEKWRDRAKKVVKRYRDERETREGNGKFNVLWSNTETLKPTLYSARPNPDIRRRWRQPDPVSSAVALSLERGVEFFMDTQPFDGVMARVVEDYLLPGRAIARVRYRPVFTTPPPVRVPLMRAGDVAIDQNGQEMDVAFEENGVPFGEIQEEDELNYEEVEVEYVPWASARLGPGKTWQDIDWIAFRHEMDRDENIENFGARIGKKIALNYTKEGEPESDGEDGKCAEVWEVWDKVNREVLFVSEGYSDAPLELKEDPLNLKDFFPVPEPLYSVRTNESMIPVPEYTLYQDQAEELDEITARINNLVDAMRVRGVYDAAMQELEQLLMGDDNKLIPVENWRALTEKGGMDGVISWMPIEQMAKTLAQLYVQRDQLLTTIYQITGISDIQRGATDPRETRGAQQLKAQFSSLRLRPRQDAVQAFVRDLVRIMAELIAENFSAQTLSQMTGVQVSPIMMQLMQNDGLRDFAIDIETDSTVATEIGIEREQATEFMRALAESVQVFAPMVQAGIMPMEAAKSIVMFSARKFKVSRELEEALESIGSGQQQQQQPDPEAMAKAVEAQTKQAKLELQAQEQRAKEAIQMMEIRLKEAELRLDMDQQEHDQRMDVVRAVQGNA